MLSTDRPEFDAQLITLCAGFNIPVGERSSAYWLGLQRMELVTFARVVIECLGPDGPEKFPTVGVCWQIAKKQRAVRYPPRAAEPEKPQWQGDHWDIEANFHLLDRVRTYPKKYADPEATRIVVRWKKTWAEDMRAEANPTPEIKLWAWQECMQSADEQIALIKRQEAA